MKQVTPDELSDLLSPPEHNWVPIGAIVKGDYVRWFDQDALVHGVRKQDNRYYVSVADPLDGEIKEHTYKLHDELFVRTKLND